MQIGMIGLGRMGANMTERLLNQGHDCVIYNRSEDKMAPLVEKGALPATTLKSLVEQLEKPRAIWMMIPAAAVDEIIKELIPLLSPEDILIDGGNSYYKDDIARSKQLSETGLHYLDVGTSGGVWGLERGYCLMIGGDNTAVDYLDPIFASLAPGQGRIERTRGRSGSYASEEQGYLHCGPSGAGHFVKMVHNGIEYGLMAAYAEGFNLLKHANIGQQSRGIDAETSPLREPETLQYDIDVAAVSELWRRGSVVSSWLLDLTANALHNDADLNEFSGQVSDSGEGRWTSIAAIESGSPAPVLTAALFNRFSSRGESDYGDQLLSAMRYEFGGHKEKK